MEHAPKKGARPIYENVIFNGRKNPGKIDDRDLIGAERELSKSPDFKNKGTDKNRDRNVKRTKSPDWKIKAVKRLIEQKRKFPGRPERKSKSRPR